MKARIASPLCQWYSLNLTSSLWAPYIIYYAGLTPRYV
jgi:hypothetical protein